MLLGPIQKLRSHNNDWSKAASRLWRTVAMPNRRLQRRMGMVLINLTLYAVLVVAYFVVVLQWLNEPLAELFRGNLVHYAMVSILLILGQGLLLDVVTSGLLQLGRRVSGKRRE